MKERDSPVPQLEDNSWIQNLAFLTDMIMFHLNQLNTKLQGLNQFAHTLFKTEHSSEVKLRIFMTHQHKLDHFQTFITHLNKT